MALIKCPECGNEVSDMAGVCPQCGNPIAPKPKEKKTLSISTIAYLFGSALIALAPMLTYVKVGLNLGTEPPSRYNMWKVLTPEAGGLKSGDSAGFFGIIPSIILIIGIVGIIVAILKMLEKIGISKFLMALIPAVSAIFFVLYESVGLKTFRDTNNEFAEILSSYDLGGLISITKGIGFYVLIIGIIVAVVSLFIKNKE